MGAPCTKFVPIPSTPTVADLRSCVSVPGAACYKLNSYKVTISSTVSEDIITSNISFDRNPSAGMIVSYNTSSKSMIVKNTSQSPVPDVGYYPDHSDFPLTAYAIFQISDPDCAKSDPIQFLFDYKTPGRIGVYSKIEEQNIFTLPGPDSVPNITATIVPSHDGNEINELVFQVVNNAGTQNYRQPVVRFAPVVCGCANSLRQKILDLGLGEAFLQYLVLRYILSGITYLKRFDVNLLRQRYNCSFLASLVGTEYDVFLSILNANPDFPRYFLC